MCRCRVICIQGTLYKNVCRKFYVPYNAGEAAPFEITGVDQYGFIVARQIPENLTGAIDKIWYHRDWS